MIGPTCAIVRIINVLIVVVVTPVHAHHSFARFDSEREMTLEGTVKEFMWTNPHARIILEVDHKAHEEQWAIEMIGPNNLARQGWRPKTLVPGMLVRLRIHPLRDGTNGGQFMEITLPDGTVLYSGSALRQ